MFFRFFHVESGFISHVASSVLLSLEREGELASTFCSESLPPKKKKWCAVLRRFNLKLCASQKKRKNKNTRREVNDEQIIAFFRSCSLTYRAYHIV